MKNPETEKYLTFSKVEEWLKKALEDDEVDEITDDFDDCSIEVISQEWNKINPKTARMMLVVIN